MTNKELRTVLLRFEGTIQPLLGLKDLIIAGIQALDSLDKAEQESTGLMAHIGALKAEEPQWIARVGEVKASVEAEIRSHQERARAAKALADEAEVKANQRAALANRQAEDAEVDTAARLKTLGGKIQAAEEQLAKLEKERDKILEKFTRAA